MFFFFVIALFDTCDFWICTFLSCCNKNISLVRIQMEKAQRSCQYTSRRSFQEWSVKHGHEIVVNFHVPVKMQKCLKGCKQNTFELWLFWIVLCELCSSTSFIIKFQRQDSSTGKCCHDTRDTLVPVNFEWNKFSKGVKHWALFQFQFQLVWI